MSADSPIFPEGLKDYIDSFGYTESKLLKENREETRELGAISIMQIGAAQGAFLSILCKIANFKNCLEVGVFTGYSSLCIGSAISKDSKLTVIDNNKEYLAIAEKYWKKAGISTKINVMNINALDALDELSETKGASFDFAFIDADKANYSKYYEKVITMMSSGGIICIDNTLWKGRVYDERIKNNNTESINSLNQLIKNDDRVEHSLLTIYDGMTICYIK
tara:strand:+ start:4617 stop:5279 length:663 start_codon:yes stop_codon:yes gene_type:complete